MRAHARRRRVDRAPAAAAAAWATVRISAGSHVLMIGPWQGVV
eukprot:SAG31_NODE_14777_length_788_cov_0.866473_1_plen_42_part_10